jgi:pSer/pThr/pTyr-binding forkhead associated (FHA) protein
MDPMTPIEPARIDELLAAYRELQAQFDRVLERLRRAEEQRTTVNRRIYDRVRSEYDRELDSIRAKLSPLRDEIDRTQESLESQCRDAGSVVQSMEEELAEAEFRHRIGEYDDAAYESIRREVDARAGEARSRYDRLHGTLATVTTLRRPDLQDVSALVDENVPAAEPSAPAAQAQPVRENPAPAPAPVARAEEPAKTVPEGAAPRPVLRPGRPAQPAPDGFENPQQWIAEMGPESSRPERRRRIVPAPAPSVSAAPAAPASPEAELDSLLSPVATSTENFPSLVFVSGPHAGQAIGLLPTTVTIGREHDNNIEIKDPEVARYHARILRERDQYVVEDLNSSTGTWVNGERKQRAVLTHGDVIRLGQTELALDFEWTTDSR